MAISSHTEDIDGLPATDWQPGMELAAGTAYRISNGWDKSDRGNTWADLFRQFLESAGVEQVEGVLVGEWDMHNNASDTSAAIVEELVIARDRLPTLRALFIGDMTYEQMEISWIEQTDLSALFPAYPHLRYLGVRGGNGLQFGTISHEQLRTLVIETGGLDAGIVQAVLRADLPNLEHLELWLGTEEYGATATIDDLAPLLAGTLFPNLRYLGLRDSYIADELAAALADAPILERIEVLDLSLGTLSDTGAEALLDNPAVARLKRLDLHHHYLSEAMMERIQALGPEVDLSEHEVAEDYDGEQHRYVAVGE